MNELTFYSARRKIRLPPEAPCLLRDGRRYDITSITEGGGPHGAVPLGVYKTGAYAKEAKAFFRECVGSDMYDSAINCDAGRRHHYVPARILLKQSDGERFCRIEQNGSLDSFPG